MKRVTITMNEGVLFAVRKIQSEMTKQTQKNVSFSRVANVTLLVGLQDRHTIRQIIEDDRKNH